MKQTNKKINKIIEMIKKAKCVYSYVSISEHDGRFFRVYKNDILLQIKQDINQDKGNFYDIDKFFISNGDLFIA